MAVVADDHFLSLHLLPLALAEISQSHQGMSRGGHGMNAIYIVVFLGFFALNFLLLAGIQTTLKFMIMRNRQMEARVETLMLESMYSKDSQ